MSEDGGGFWRRRGEGEELREAVVIESVGGSGDPVASCLVICRVWNARVIWSDPGSRDPERDGGTGRCGGPDRGQPRRLELLPP